MKIVDETLVCLIIYVTKRLLSRFAKSNGISHTSMINFCGKVNQVEVF